MRIHGRGGQGVVTAAELLSLAAFDQGLHAQALPSFGSERTGAPVVAFCRIDERPIRSHDPVDHPDLVVLQDPTLLRAGDVLDGLADDGIVVVNSSPHVRRARRQPGSACDRGQRLVTVPATELSRERLGRPLPNTALLGAVAAVTGVVSLEAVRGAIRQRFASRPDECGRGQRAAGRRRPRPGHSRGGAAPCLGRSKVLAPWPTRSRAAARRSSRRTPSHRRPTSSRGSPIWCAAGDLAPCEYLLVESEFGALSACIGASAAGARAYTATSSQGLLFMAEALPNASGLGLPIVMTVANRALGAPINIWNDHSDALSQRDAGWIQLFASSNQEAVDLHVQAFALAERLSLPVMVCMDGFVLTHAMEEIDVPDQAAVDAFLPPFAPRQWLDPDDPVTIGAMVGPGQFTEVKYLMARRQLAALDDVAARR